MNALFDLHIPPDLLVHLACQAEYGTGVRAGSLDQATEQRGEASKGTLISSNPNDNFHILGTYAVPAKQIAIFFPYSVARDREAWRWSWGMYSEGPRPQSPLTAGEVRKLTGKAAEIAAILVRLPLGTSFFKIIEQDLLDDGALSDESEAWICNVLRQLPLLAPAATLQSRLEEQRDWLTHELCAHTPCDLAPARAEADATLTSLLTGWRDPVLRRTTEAGEEVTETGVPLRAIVAYLFAEVVKNFHLIHHQDQWIRMVTASQTGDRCVDIDLATMPERAQLEQDCAWEHNFLGSERLNAWLNHLDARPVNYNSGLDDASLAAGSSPLQWGGTSFFRGLPLIDLAEAMLKKVFGSAAVAVRVNAAGQGDFFQVHVDRAAADPEDVKAFLQQVFYYRFGLTPDPAFVETHPGAGATGLRLSRYALIPALVDRLRSRGPR